ncbi:hypothetical protein XELAEV_18000678mg [Xenopus laevis]|nr:hypothetical protein XELAEV_18000678mg [Xenopus laevis]
MTDCRREGELLALTLRRSKTDQSGKGQVIRLGKAAGTSCCQMVMYQQYLEVRPNFPGPLLIHQDCTFLTRFQFKAVLQKCVRSLGWGAKGFKPHSFHIGAPTEAALLGLPEDHHGHREVHCLFGLQVILTFTGLLGMPIPVFTRDNWEYTIGRRRLLLLLSRYADRDGPPQILVLHAGGNDLSSVPMRLLIQDIKCDWWRLMGCFLESLIVWSDIVDRFTCKARVKVNREVGKFAVRTGDLALRHMVLEEKEVGVYRRDGVHLNEIGSDIFNMSLQEGIERALEVWGSKGY